MQQNLIVRNNQFCYKHSKLVFSHFKGSYFNTAYRLKMEFKIGFLCGMESQKISFLDSFPVYKCTAFDKNQHSGIRLENSN